jgi:hypothetical protein
MALDASQIINNMKKSFNTYIENSMSGATINFDEDPFETDGLESWYAVRYTGFSSEPVAMGEIVDENGTKGRLHRLNSEVSAWSSNDSQRANLGGMIDAVVALMEAGMIAFYDYDDPEDPDEIGKMRVKSGKAAMTPGWSGNKYVWKSARDIHAEKRIAGYVLEVEIQVIAEI